MKILNLCIFLKLPLVIFANTEKTIFFGPSRVSLSVPQKFFADDIPIEAISPQFVSIRTKIQAEFPTNSSRHGHQSWYLLHGLSERQRYEVRICWAATQPTSFNLKTYEFSKLYETPSLLSSLIQYLEMRKSLFNDVEKIDHIHFLNSKRSEGQHSSTLLLHIFAAAEYHTTEQRLMQQVPPVNVDIILDLYILNILPRSLIPTIMYIIMLATIAWFLSGFLGDWILLFSRLELKLRKS